jgi:hypothetical protein
MTDNIFEVASRTGLRFGTSKGALCADDLWHLPLTSKNGVNLDDIARSYSRELKAQEEESFVTKPAQKDSTMELGFKIVKRVIEYKLAEREATKASVDKAAQKELLKSLIAKKKVEELGATDIKDLEKQLKALG